MKSIISLLLSVVILFSLCACSGNGNNYVLSIDGDKISKGEYMVYLYEQKKSFEERGGADIWDADFDGTSAEEVAKQNAINSITLVKAALAQADNLNITLNDEDYADIKTETEKLYNDIGQTKARIIGVTEEDIRRIIEESHIQQKVYELVTDGFEINEDDFEQYFNEHYDSEISRYNNLTLKQIHFPADTDESTVNYDKAVAARSEIKNGDDFDRVQNEYMDSTKSDAFVLEDDMYDDSIRTTLYHLPQGAVSDVLEGTDGYYIFKIISVEAPDMDSVREGLKAEYIREKKMEIYQAQNDQWQSNMKIEKNEVIYDIIDIKDC
jgi:parvulin-like peptidyl-prolyl isomerase